jgi:hypothetical protein
LAERTGLKVPYIHETDGLIAPIVHNEIETREELEEMIAQSQNPFWFIDAVEEWKQILCEYMNDQRDIAKKSGDERALERESMATYGFSSAAAVLLNWRNEDIEHAIRFAATLGYCVAKLEDLGFESAAQAQVKSLRGSAKGAARLRGRTDAILHRVEDWFVAQFTRDPNKRLCALLDEASLKFGVNRETLRKRFRKCELIAKARRSMPDD